MTIDKEKLKADAEYWRDYRDPCGQSLGAMPVEPENVLAMLAEIERLEFEPAKHARRLIDQLKAENETLRKQMADLSPFKNMPPQDYRASNKCLACGEYHHGLGNLPCPRCTPVAQSAMAREASHE